MMYSGVSGSEEEEAQDEEEREALAIQQRMSQMMQETDFDLQLFQVKSLYTSGPNVMAMLYPKQRIITCGSREFVLTSNVFHGLAGNFMLVRVCTQHY